LIHPVMVTFWSTLKVVATVPLYLVFVMVMFSFAAWSVYVTLSVRVKFRQVAVIVAVPAVGPVVRLTATIEVFVFTGNVTFIVYLPVVAFHTSSAFPYMVRLNTASVPEDVE